MSIQQNFPAISPSLSLNFARSKTLDPRITFTRTSTATRVNGQGLIEVVSADTPRFDHSYDPVSGTVKSLGLLIEESRVNRTTYSDYSSLVQLSQVSKSSTVFTLSPDGSSIPAFEANNNTSSTHRIGLNNGNTGSATTPHTASFFIKIPPIGLDQISSSNTIVIIVRWRSSSGSGTGAAISYNQTTQEYSIYSGVNGFGTNAPTTYNESQGYIVDYPNGWKRFVFPNAVASTNSADTFYLYDWNIAENSGETPGNCTVFLWGAQFEEGSFPTSYIPTSGSTATRSPDNVSMTGTNFSDWYNPNEGTVYADTTMVGVQTGRYDRLWAITNSNLNLEGISIYVAGPAGTPSGYVSSVTITNGATEQVGGALIESALTTPKLKSAFAFKQNDCASAYNGQQRFVDSIVDLSSFTTPLDRLLIGQPQRYQGYSCMTVSQLTYYPRRLTNEQLLNLTK